MRGRDGKDSGDRPYLRPDNVRVTCDLSGFQCGSDQMKRTWDGFLVREDFWYPRQPQDFPLFTRGVTSVLDARPLNSVNAPGAYGFLDFIFDQFEGNILDENNAFIQG